jgi:hypothetical protein
MQLQKTEKKIEELIVTINKEFTEACDLRAAEERLVAMRSHEQNLEEHIKAYERHKIWSTIEEIGGDNPQVALERNNKIVATVITMMDYIKTHPKCTPDDLTRLGMPLPAVMDPGMLIMIVRCSRIVEKYESHKGRLLSSVFELVRGAPAEV